MSSNRISINDIDLDEIENLPTIRNLPRSKVRSKPTANKSRLCVQPIQDEIAQLVEQPDGEDHFNFTYSASHHERQWIVNSLGGFYDSQWLDDVLHLIKGGKEAHVYQCLANPSVPNLEQPYLAAKIYRPRMFRNLRKDHVYREGRQNLDENGHAIINSGMIHAMHRHTAYGQELLHTSWVEYEFQALCVLFEAGADVPHPYARGNNAILMSYIGGDDVSAPTLNTVDLRQKEARQLFDRVLHNIQVMLDHHRVHGDLSAYNILYWNGDITLIDFPQVVDPQVNRNAFGIFERDVTRICEYFASQGVKSNPRRIAADLWKAHDLRQMPEVHPALLDEEDETDRAFWQSQSGS
ncbi:MAG: hypothetical protein JXB15_13230 [Anaerolineales bacterium]|nr:hypothetical protein [Anaerolineales bacterium]